MPESKRPLKVFLCHAHADRDPVRGLYTRLTQDGVDAWLDKAKLLPGQDWEFEIRKAVREADVVVVCLSKQFNHAGFRQKEVRLALDTAMEKPEGEIFIIPARLEECENLESLRKWHWVDLFEYDGYEMLMRALRARADKIGATLQVKKRRSSKNNITNRDIELESAELKQKKPEIRTSKLIDGTSSVVRQYIAYIQYTRGVNPSDIARILYDKLKREMDLHFAKKDPDVLFALRETVKYHPNTENIVREFLGKYLSADEIEQELKEAKQELRERVLEAAIEKQVFVDAPASLFVWIKRLESKSIISVVNSIDEDIVLDEDNVKAKGLELEFPIENGRALPIGVTLRLVAHEFNPPLQQKKIIVPTEGDSEVCTFLITPMKAGKLLLSLEVIRDEFSLASRTLRTTAIEADKKISSSLVFVTIPIIVLAQVTKSSLESISSAKLENEDSEETDRESTEKVAEEKSENLTGEVIRLFNMGRFDEAIDKADMAYQDTHLPKYKNMANKYRQFKVDYKDISETIFLERGIPDTFIAALKKLDLLSSEYDEHPVLQNLRKRLQVRRPLITEALNQEIKELKARIERAYTIESAEISAQQAKLKIDQVRQLGVDVASFARLNQDVLHLIAELEQLDDSLARAEDAYSRQRAWPAEAWTLSAEVRERFPSDPKVLRLQDKLSRYKATQTSLKVSSLLVILVIFFLLGFNWILPQYNAYVLLLTPTPPFTVSPNPTSKVVFSPTTLPLSTETFIPTVTKMPTSLPTEITDSKGIPMALVPEGNFTMGSADSFANEKPVLLVYLDSFYIDKYEVTNRNYNLCVQVGECVPPKKRGSKTQTSYFGNPVFDNYPVIYVTWDMAQKYCQWRDGRLPSEAEWEKAARGVAGRIYPWGDTIKNTEANYNGLIGDLAVVGKYNSGVSPYGLFDMAGNAQEWVNDWYQENYYSSLFGDVKNPLGPSTGDERIIRGGSWDAGKNFIRTTYRFKSSPSVSFYNISFRCAKDVTP